MERREKGKLRNVRERWSRASVAEERIELSGLSVWMRSFEIWRVSMGFDDLMRRNPSSAVLAQRWRKSLNWDKIKGPMSKVLRGKIIATGAFF